MQNANGGKCGIERENDELWGPDSKVGPLISCSVKTQNTLVPKHRPVVAATRLLGMGKLSDGGS